MQHLGGHEAHHRRAMEKRQIRTVITRVVVEDDETFTTRITSTVPLISLPGRPPRTTADPDETTARSTSVATPPPARPSSSAPSSRPTSSSSSVSSSAPPSSSSSATSRPVASSSSSSSVSSDVKETTTVFVPATPSASASSVAGNSNDTVGATSTGQTVGIVVGIVAGVIGIAIFAAFIVRHMRKRARDKESWDASKFRRSALLLPEEKSNGGNGGAGGPPAPRPPSMIEHREQANTSSMVGAPTRAYPYTDVPTGGFQPQDQLGYSRAGTPQQPQQYGAPNPYGAAPIPYTGQNMYGQGAERGYGSAAAAGMGTGYGAGAAYGGRTGTPHQGMDMMDMHHPGYPVRSNGHNSLPPFASYALPPINTGAPATVARTNTTASNLPNPFAERAPAPAQTPPSRRDSGSSGHGTASGAPVRANQPRYMTRNGDEDEQEQRDAPPAYTDDGSYAKMQRDVKNPVVMSVEGTTVPSTATGASGAPAPATPAPAPDATATGNNRARPMSSHTVYDPSDAYGGM